MRAARQHTIELDARAPAKPAPGEPCNGCGICCAAEPCPVALMFLFQRKGRCRALAWDAVRNRYRCGMATAPHRHCALVPAALAAWAGAFFASRIAAGTGCDSDIEVA